jgi:PadR family transcriptional regulator, regulatory protein PadR
LDIEAINRKFQKELNSGAISLVILGLLARVGRAMYGYEIGKHLEELCEGSLPMHQGALYPALRSMEKSGLLGSEVEPSVSGPPRRYYQITPAGRQSLIDWSLAWRQTKQFVDSILEHTRGDDDNSPASSGSAVLDGARESPDADPRNGDRGRVDRC